MCFVDVTRRVEHTHVREWPTAIVVFLVLLSQDRQFCDLRLLDIHTPFSQFVLVESLYEDHVPVKSLSHGSPIKQQKDVLCRRTNPRKRVA